MMDNVNNYDNMKESGEKRKFNSESEEIYEEELISLSCKSKINETSFDTVKKQCSWRPPIKNEKESHANICLGSDNISNKIKSEFSNVLDKSESNIKLLFSSQSQENETVKDENLQNTETVFKINKSLINNYNNNNDFDKDDISISSMETVPIKCLEDEIKNQIEAACEKYTNEEFLSLDISSGENIISEKDVDSTQNANDNVIKSINDMNDSDPEEMTPEEIKILLTNKLPETQEEKVEEQFPDESKTETINDLKQFTNDEVDLIEKIDYPVKSDQEQYNTKQEFYSNNMFYQNENNTESSSRIIPQIGIPSNNAPLPSISFSGLEDTFDITKSQLEKVEGDVTSAIYNQFTKPIDNRMRIKKEHKQTLQRIIKEVDLLNATIIGAINELKTHSSKINIPNTNFRNN